MKKYNDGIAYGKSDATASFVKHGDGKQTWPDGSSYDGTWYLG